jgi:type I restriction enzyme S subunit
MTSKLSDYCYFADGRISVADLDLDSYISTENMLPNKEGITRSAGLPTLNQTQAYQADDVLVSNIRPYFRKIWFADRDGGCSNDVLVLRAKATCSPGFLYYLLSDNNFFDYATATGKGTKMPRGDKGAIMHYAVPAVPIDTQIGIADTLSALDARIAENRKINHHLEQMAQLAFEQFLIEACVDEPIGALSDIAEINPSRSLSRGQETIYIEMANLPTHSSFPTDWVTRSFSGGMKFTNGDTIMARITPCLENGKTAYINFLEEGTVAFGSTEYIVITSKPGYCNEMFYYLARYPDFVNYAVRNMNGSSGRQRVSGDAVGRYELHIPASKNIREFAEVATPIMDAIRQNALESRNLAALRDSLLPRLMSGELSVADLGDAK